MFSLQKCTRISQFNSLLFLTCPKWFPQTFLSHLSPINKQDHCFNFSLWNTFRLQNICKNCGKKRIPYTLYVLYQTSPKVNLLLNHSPIIKTTPHMILAPHLQILFKFHPQSQVQSRTTHYNSCPVSLCAQFSSVTQSCPIFATPWTTARQASLSITNSWSPPKPMSIESVMPSSHLILCRPLLLLPSIFPSIRVFSNE